MVSGHVPFCSYKARQAGRHTLPTLSKRSARANQSMLKRYCVSKLHASTRRKHKMRSEPTHRWRKCACEADTITTLSLPTWLSHRLHRSMNILYNIAAYNSTLGPGNNNRQPANPRDSQRSKKINGEETHRKSVAVLA